MKVYLFLYKMDGEPYIVWIKQKEVADMFCDYLAYRDAMYIEKFEYTIAESDIVFSDDEYVGEMVALGFLGEES